jgi:hypothetical protein
MNEPAQRPDNPYEAPSAFPSIDTKASSTPTTPSTDKPPIPGWAWLFVVACGLIPIVSLGGGIPAALGCGGAAACVGVARNPAQSLEVRIGLCCGITVLCWGLFVGLLVLVFSVQAGRG